MPKVVASIEARMNSSRLPGKILSDINGQPSLTRMVRRLRKCQKIDDIIVATSDNPSDDVVEEWSINESVSLYRGSEDDVLKRVVMAQQTMHSDIVAELCGDCPLIDPDVIDLAVETYLNNNCDVVTTTQKQSWPQGVDVQVFSLQNLQEVEKKISDPAVREHVSLYFYENPDKFSIFNILAPREYYAPDLRLQLDYKEDYEFINSVYRILEEEKGEFFSTLDVINLIKTNPDLATINAHCEERSAR